MTSFILRSLDRAGNSTNSSDCRFLLSDNGLRRGEHKHIELRYVNVYNTPYTIQAGVNDKINFNENSTNKTATLTPGVYNAASLATEIQTDLNTASGGYNTYSVTYSSTTRKLTFSAGFSFTLQFASGANSSTSCWRECGFIASSGASAAVDSSTGTSVVAPFPVNLALPMSWFIRMDPLAGSTISSASGAPFTWYVPCTAANGDVMEFKSNSYFRQIAQLPDSHILNDWTVRFVNSSGSNINLNGSEWEIVLQLC